MNQYYGMRRKRNIDLSRQSQSLGHDYQYEVELEEDKEVVELEEGYEEIEEVEEYEEEVHLPDDYQSEQNYFMLDGKPFKLKQQFKKESFSETHVRVTTYLDKNIHQIIKMLQHHKQIESITKFINDSIKDQLMNKYNQDK
ncbi:hypothetical protein ACFSCX_00325 [Bacillus salitolerans]|uniref:Uncharacterized protein n=1 Tax=Bacillus salitolerans TaxID=1437434 RepID=A0ABW4LKK1_9BACI